MQARVGKWFISYSVDGSCLVLVKNRAELAFMIFEAGGVVIIATRKADGLREPGIAWSNSTRDFRCWPVAFAWKVHRLPKQCWWEWERGLEKPSSICAYGDGPDMLRRLWIPTCAPLYIHITCVSVRQDAAHSSLHGLDCRVRHAVGNNGSWRTRGRLNLLKCIRNAALHLQRYFFCVHILQSFWGIVGGQDPDLAGVLQVPLCFRTGMA